MELRIATPEQLQYAYRTDLAAAFPRAELKPLESMETMWAQGRYRPYCLFDGGEIVGEAFLWTGHDGWAILDYLCVAASRRNDGLGAEILRLLPLTEPDTVIFGEAEDPVYAPDPAMAERRLAFYHRCGLRTAEYDTEMFGVRYKTLYLYRNEVDSQELMKEHYYIYESSFRPDLFARYVRIPRDPAAPPMDKVPWEQ